MPNQPTTLLPNDETTAANALVATDPWLGQALPTCDWRAPPRSLSWPPPTEQPAVWRVAIDASCPYDLASCKRLLDAQELSRAERFHFDRHRERFIRAHGSVRQILSRYLTTAPEALAFEYGRYKKPALMAPHADLHFNYSHSGDYLLLMVGSQPNLGIDIEAINCRHETLSIADRFFSPAECHCLKQFSLDQQRVLFFQYWSLKEAFIKAKGEGLHYPLHAFSIDISDCPPTLVTTRDCDQDSWQLLSTTPVSGYAAGLACPIPANDDILITPSFYALSS